MRQPIHRPPPAMGNFAHVEGLALVALRTDDIPPVQVSTLWDTSGGVTTLRQQPVLPGIKLWQV
jgi:hypothetical protein